MSSSQSISSSLIQQMQPYYKVQAILDKKIVKGKAHYLVWWVGYPKQEATWQPFSNLNTPAVKQMCTEFDESMQLSNISKKQKPSKLSQIYCDSSQSKNQVRKRKIQTKANQYPESKKSNSNEKKKSTKIISKNSQKILDRSINSSISKEKFEESDSDSQKSVIDRYISQKQAGLLNLKGHKFEIRIPKREQLKIKNVIKASTQGQNLFFYVSLMNSDLGTKISHEQMKLFYPYELLDFYESKMKWQDKL